MCQCIGMNLSISLRIGININCCKNIKEKSRSDERLFSFYFICGGVGSSINHYRLVEQLAKSFS